MTPLFIIDGLQALGFGQQVFVAAVIGLAVLYLFRGRKLAQTVVGLVGTAWLVAVAVGIGLAVVFAVGWANPQPAKFVSDVQAGGEVFAEMVWTRLTDALGLGGG